MNEQRFGWNYFENEVVIGNKKRMIVIVLSNFMDIPYNKKSFDEIVTLLNEQQTIVSKLKEENKQLQYESQQIKEYLQTKINECKDYKKMKEIVFGVEQAVGYEKALLQFQKGLKRRLKDD